tara:strand:- start:86 stop:706 length:621 start_codon:yes stop_codon:yes gene_type:complete
MPATTHYPYTKKRYAQWREDVERSRDLDFPKKDTFWRIRNWKSKENAWDYNTPVSSVNQTSLYNATATFESNHGQRNYNLDQIEANNKRIETINSVMETSSDPTQIRDLAMERNTLSMANGSLVAENEVYKVNAENALKIVHTHRGDIAEFYEEGPYIREGKSAFINGVMVAGTAVAMYYYLTTRRPTRRLFSRPRRTPIGASFSR